MGCRPGRELGGSWAMRSGGDRDGPAKEERELGCERKKGNGPVLPARYRFKCSSLGRSASTCTVAQAVVPGSFFFFF
jgi:hypothetical protein